MWLLLAFVSAFLLGIYDVAKKNSLSGNAVIPVLFFTTLFNVVLFLPIWGLSMANPSPIKETIYYIPKVGLTEHLLYVTKAVIVLFSWLFAYFSMKHLPITITSPIKATQPILVLLGALIIFQERLNVLQWIGVTLAISSVFLLSKTGKKEGIDFKHNKWILFIVLATIIGAVSGLYDKYLLKSQSPMAVQVYYNFYQLIIMALVLFFLWYPTRGKTTPFKWKWSIPLISLFLSLADFSYFYSLSFDGAMISIVSNVRRSGVVVSFIAGAFFFGEKNLKNKALDIILLLIGMIFLYLGSK